MAEQRESLVIRIRTKEVRITLRKDGRWTLTWREEGVSRNTTKKTKLEAERKARSIAMDLDRGEWTEKVSKLEAESLRLIKERLPQGLRLTQATEAFTRMLDISMSYKDLLLFVEEAEAKAAAAKRYTRLTEVMSSLEKHYTIGTKYSRETWRGLYQEFNGMIMVITGDAYIQDMDKDFLEDWCARGESGDQTFNNRLTHWITIFNRCKKWGFLPDSEASIAEQIEKRIVAKKHPAIFSIGEVRSALNYLATLNDMTYLFAFSVAAFTGMRPSEIKRLKKMHFDLEKGYIHADATICRKLKEERYIPISRQLTYILDFIWDELSDNVVLCSVNGWRKLSEKLRVEGCIDSWPEDVLRHSYISYEIAATKDINTVAEHCGNSPAVIRARYKKPVKVEQGAEYKRLLPDEIATIRDADEERDRAQKKDDDHVSKELFESMVRKLVVAQMDDST